MPGLNLELQSGMNVTRDTTHKTVYWHRELPPVSAEPIAEHIVEATSSRVRGISGRRYELWDRCYDELMANAQLRISQEVVRLGEHYAHVRDESVDTRRDDATGDAWLHGLFTYTLYRRPL